MVLESGESKGVVPIPAQHVLRAYMLQHDMVEDNTRRAEQVCSGLSL